MYILHIIQLTPQKLSAELKNRPGGKGASAWPEDQRMHRKRRPRRRRYQEVPLLEILLLCFLSQALGRDAYLIFVVLTS